MLRPLILFGLLGLVAASAIIAWSGYGQVLQALHAAGWGILATSAFHVIPVVISSLGWWALLPGKKRGVTYPFMFYVLWLRSAVNNLMPVARIGGELVAVRVMTKHGLRKTLAIASTTVELTLSVLAVFLFDLSGIGAFTWHLSDRAIGWRLLMGVLLSLPVVAALVIVQRAGFFGLLDKIFTLMLRDTWTKLALNMRQLDRVVHQFYRRRGRILFCFFCQLVAWTSGMGEVWLALTFLGHPLPLSECFMIEALIQTSTSAAFMIPGALGVQEAGFLLFGGMLGLPREIATALAVIRRCRDLLLYLPGLAAWQIQEGRWLLRKK